MSNHYTIQKQIGKGAFGSIALVIDIRTNKQYALKTTHNSFGTSVVRHLIVEISTLKLFTQAFNIIHIVDVISSATHNPDIILQLCAGTLNEYPPSDLLSVRYMMFDIINGLLSLHNKFICHLDLKPGNILYCDEEPEPRYVITDFGTAIKNIYTTNLPCHVQTVPYRAPEIILANAYGMPCNYDDRADLWSAGIIFGQFLMRIYNSKWRHPSIKLSIDVKFITDKQEENRRLLDGIYRIFGQTCNPELETSGLQEPKVPITSLRETFKAMPDLEYDFMMSILKLNPYDRPQFRELFSHPYFDGFFCE